MLANAWHCFVPPALVSEHLMLWRFVSELPPRAQNSKCSGPHGQIPSPKNYSAHVVKRSTDGAALGRAHTHTHTASYSSRSIGMGAPTATTLPAAQARANPTRAAAIASANPGTKLRKRVAFASFAPGCSIVIPVELVGICLPVT